MRGNSKKGLILELLPKEDDATVGGEADLNLSLASSRAPSLPPSHLTSSRDTSLGPPHPDRRGSRYPAVNFTASNLPPSPPASPAPYST